jgi:hypothetical protein
MKSLNVRRAIAEHRSIFPAFLSFVFFAPAAPFADALSHFTRAMMVSMRLRSCSSCAMTCFA